MGNSGSNIKMTDHVPGNEHFKVSDTIIVNRIQGVGQPVIEILLGRDIGEDDIENL
jgi:hypothetical protein